MSTAPARRAAWGSVLVAVLVSIVGVAASTLGGAAGAATVAQGLDCGIGGAQTMNVTGTAPSTVLPGGTFTVDLDVASAKANGAAIENLVWSFEAPTGTSVVAGSATKVGSGSGSLGTVTTTISGNVVQLKAAGPIANGASFEPPTLRFDLTAGAAAGTALSVRVRQNPAYSLKAAGFNVSCSTTGTRGAITTTTVTAAPTSSSSTASTVSTPGGTTPTTTTTTTPEPTEVTWSPTGSCGTVGTTVVPAGATSADLTAVGGSGGKGGQVAGATGASGQAGGQVDATMAVTPGQTISGVVGCGGTNGSSSSGPGGAGFGTGGSGGKGNGVVTSDHYGGGGGGASAICVGASCLSGQGGVSPRVVAGGGGGGGSLNCAGTSVGAGGRGGNGSITSAGGGSGASGLAGGNGLHSTGGAGGVTATQGGSSNGHSGGNGSQGSGTNSGGGGGGGGYIGGSGGTGTTGGAALCAGGGGGGGGSSWAVDGLAGASFTQPGGDASVTVVFTVDPVPTPDIIPFDTTEDLVVQQFEDLLGRAPTTEERDTAVEEIDTFDRVAEDLIVHDLLSEDQHAVDAQVIRLYLAYFGRPPETAGLEYWVAAIEGGKSVHTASNQFAAMNEFRTLYGPLTNRAFVELVYQNVLGRAGEPAGLDYWTGELDAGRFKRGTVMTQFSEAPENRTAKTVHVGVVRIYLAMLESTPKKAYLNAAVAPFLAGHATVLDTLEWVAADVRHSAAYATRVG
jgi:hypothetical protein